MWTMDKKLIIEKENCKFTDISIYETLKKVKGK